MPIWLNPRGKTTLGIAICDRCRRKLSLDDLRSDPNSPGLKVCRGCCDKFDPYRLPARKSDNLTLRFVRPDAPLTVPDE